MVLPVLIWLGVCSISCTETSLSKDTKISENKPAASDQRVQKKVAHKSPIDSSKHHKYTWINEYTAEDKLINRIEAPEGSKRIELPATSFGAWLRNVPTKKGRGVVMLFDGRSKRNQQAHHLIVDLDVGTRDLQQCADAVMRLRSEYLFQKRDYSQIHFNYTSGDKVSWDDWRNGRKPIVRGNSVSFSSPSGSQDNSYNNFKKYLVSIFSYAGTASLEKEMNRVEPDNIMPGDVFIQGGSPGHAVLVMDVATDRNGQKFFLLGQSYMPAQEFHILKNPSDGRLSPWYRIKPEGTLATPEWNFDYSDLKRFQ